MWTEYCTSYSSFPTQSIAKKSSTGPATVLIQGLGVGMISCVIPVIILVVIIVACDALAGNVENSHVHNSILQNTHTLENRYVDGILYFLQFFPDPVYREKVINRTSYCVDPRSWSRYDLMCDSRHYLGCDHCGL